MHNVTTTYKNWAYIEGLVAARCRCDDICLCVEREDALHKLQQATNRARYAGSREVHQIARDEASYWLGYVHGKGTPTPLPPAEGTAWIPR